MNKTIFVELNYLFCPKYIKAKNENVLTKAIKYQPDDELLVNSDIYLVYLSECLIILEKIMIDIIKRTKRM